MLGHPSHHSYPFAETLRDYVSSYALIVLYPSQDREQRKGSLHLVGLIRSPETPKSRKCEKFEKLQNHPPRVGTRKYEKHTEKQQK